MSTDIRPQSEPAQTEPVETESAHAEPAQTSRVEVSEREARELAEAARDIEYTRPSFAKELYLGKFDLSPAPAWRG